MTKIEAYKADDGTIHETVESARNADARLLYKHRVGDFVARSPLIYEAARDLEGWLLTDDGYANVLILAGIA